MLKWIKLAVAFVKRFKNLLLLALAGLGVAVAIARLKLGRDYSNEDVWANLVKRLEYARRDYFAKLEALKAPQEPQAVVDEFNKRFGG